MTFLLKKKNRRNNPPVVLGVPDTLRKMVTDERASYGIADPKNDE